MELHVGTSGYSYKEWKGPFYPEDLSAKDMLSYYGERLNAVEINNTFYRLPKASVLEGWASQVPEAFRFSIKASRRITHFTRLKEEARDPTEYLLSTITSLGDRLGVLLFQMPPNLKKDAPRLAHFLDMLPDGTPAAFEFRHASWKDDEIYDALRQRDMAFVCADTDDTEDDEPPVATASWGYLRLRRPDYEDVDLMRWSEQIGSLDWKRAFVFFKHEDEGAGPKLAARFRDLATGQGGG
ncbi:MAG: DUF72 domain-containing protein [Gemmatimonadota bacterium]|nr:DUF72 domain-containing protein [Gemmatimonadota bacterium]MDH3422736.1 DUF72 domain-containing protein [Gemmatimonadota bacterium]